MVCINCGKKTLTYNSRFKIKTNTVWRRRKCLSCDTSFSTTELPLLSKSLVIEDNKGKLTSFSRDKLYLSIYNAIEHNVDAIERATALTETIIGKLTNYISSGYVSSTDIRHLVQVALNRYDALASIKYSSEK